MENCALSSRCMEILMYLTVKQLLYLFIPFLIGMVVYMFEDSIVGNIQYFFPSYSEYTNKTLDKKADIYLKIDAKYKIYKEIKEKMRLRPESSSWVVDHIFYKKLQKKMRQEMPLQRHKREHKPVWRLEAIFAKEKVAIINGKMVSIGSVVSGARIVEIKKEMVCLKSKKGKECLHLFH